MTGLGLIDGRFWEPDTEDEAEDLVPQVVFIQLLKPWAVGSNVGGFNGVQDYSKDTYNVRWQQWGQPDYFRF